MSHSWQRWPVALLCVLWPVLAAAAQQDPLREGVAALERGDYGPAESAARLRLRTVPEDPAALGLLAVALDNQQKYEGAAKCYRRALARAPDSVSLLNNYGNHLLATGQAAAARATFLKVVRLRPSHPNANAQLARLALDAKAGPEAIRYLDRLPAEAQRSPDIALVRMRALYLTDRRHEAEAMFADLETASRSDSRLSLLLGLTLATAGEYQRAEALLAHALELGRADFDVLYNLGLAAWRANHPQRAYATLRAALQQRPDDVDTLFSLAAIDADLQRYEAALAWLARAAKLAPQRADVQRSLAETTFTLGYYPDSALAWDRYVKLAPGDDTGRRERGLATALKGGRREGLADLEWYVDRHPGDATGHYETAIALGTEDSEAGLRHLDRTIELAPEFSPAYYARGVILYRANRPEAALADFRLAAAREPANATVLDQLGNTYLALDRAAEALPHLRKAAELNPNDSRMLMHLGRALSRTGRTEEAREVMARFRALSAGQPRGMPAAGYVELLALSREQQYARYRARVEKAVASDPDDAQARLRYLLVLLGDQDWLKAEGIAHEMASRNVPPSLLTQAGRALLDAGRYAAAKQVLQQCPGAELNLAISVFHADGFAAGLQLMDAMPRAQRDGHYYLARAQMLDRAGRIPDALAAVGQALRAAPGRAELYVNATPLLIKNGRAPEASQFLDEATRRIPDNPSLLLAKAMVFEIAARFTEAEALLREIEKRWPEWAGVHLTHGIILAHHHKAEQALTELNIALALGASDLATYYYLAEATMDANPDETEAAWKAIQEALVLDANDPWVRTLAGHIACRRGDYAEALKHLLEAVRQRPNMMQAHYFLAQAYRGLGRSQEAQQAAERAKLLLQQYPEESEDPDLLHSNLFGVAPPR